MGRFLCIHDRPSEGVWRLENLISLFFFVGMVFLQDLFGISFKKPTSPDMLGPVLTTSHHPMTCCSWQPGERRHFGVQAAIPIGSMYGIFTCIWLIFMVDIGRYSIHWSYGIWEQHKTAIALSWFVAVIPCIVHLGIFRWLCTWMTWMT